MKSGFCVVVIAMVACLGPASAPGEEGAASRPATSSAPAVQVDPAVEKVLDRLEARGRKIEDVEANLQYKKIDTALEDTQRYDGVLRFKQGKPNPKFFIRFDKRVHEGRIFREKEWHVFDGRWYWEAREKTQQINKTEIVAPGEEKEVFRLGKGPFPLPFGQKKEDILRHFSVELVPPGEDDPPKSETDHLVLTPLPRTEMAEKYDKVHFWVDRKLDLPIQVKTSEKENYTDLVVAFSNVKINTKLDAKKLELPELPDYQINEERLATKPPKAEPGANQGIRP